jgi:hypothetical protein
MRLANSERVSRTRQVQRNVGEPLRARDHETEMAAGADRESCPCTDGAGVCVAVCVWLCVRAVASSR